MSRADQATDVPCSSTSSSYASRWYSARSSLATAAPPSSSTAIASSTSLPQHLGYRGRAGRRGTHSIHSPSLSPASSASSPSAPLPIFCAAVCARSSSLRASSSSIRASALTRSSSFSSRTYLRGCLTATPRLTLQRCRSGAQGQGLAYHVTQEIKLLIVPIQSALGFQFFIMDHVTNIENKDTVTSWGENRLSYTKPPPPIRTVSHIALPTSLQSLCRTDPPRASNNRRFT